MSITANCVHASGMTACTGSWTERTLGNTIKDWNRAAITMTSTAPSERRTKGITMNARVRIGATGIRQLRATALAVVRLTADMAITTGAMAEGATTIAGMGRKAIDSRRRLSRVSAKIITTGIVLLSAMDLLRRAPIQR